MFQEPPPAALEFLVKIREVISIAKHKMEAKRFHPLLNEIPEEETYSSNGNSIDVYQGLGSQRSGSVVSLKRENSRKKNCLGCPGCTTFDENGVQHSMKYNVPPCTNCLGSKGDKQSSIRKWLENIPSAKNSYNDFVPNSSQNLATSLLSIPEQRHKIRKQNSFTSSNTMYKDEEYSKTKKSSSMSVKSEPMLRTHNYNIPLPEFETTNYHQSLNNYYTPTVAQANDISLIGLNNYRSGSLRNKAISQLRNKNDLPDMVNEAIALDHCTKSYNQSSSDEERFGANPNTKNVNPYTRNSPESPITNDYETDSLERNSNKKGISASTTEYPDIPSSQASPSLSNALPLEEELTMRNAVYKTHSSSNSNTPSPHRNIHIDNHYETIGKRRNDDSNATIGKRRNDGSNATLDKKKTSKAKSDYSLVSEVYVNNNYNFGSTPTSPSASECSMGSRKLIAPTDDSEEKPGCLTIELKDPPENYIKIHESDGFEPDTLDRKHPKHKSTMESVEFSTNVFNFNTNESRPSQRIQLRSSGTFKKPVLALSPKFHSLRNEYEQRTKLDRPKLSSEIFSGSKSLEETTEDVWEETPPEWSTEEGRILTLEHRHSKRQRQSTPPTIKQLKNLARPDILPPLPPSSEDPIYEQPAYPPRRVESEKKTIETLSKNLNGRSLSPRAFPISTELVTSDHSLLTADSSYDLCSPMRASVQSQSSEYENTDTVKPQWKGGSFRTFSRERSGRGFGSSGINTDTFVKNNKTESKRFRRKKSNVQDSGYLSSDSSSRQMPRKLVVAKIVSCSESDDTENEARSESGAESVETHSVYFDNFRKPSNENCDYRYNNNSKSSRESGRNKRTINDL